MRVRARLAFSSLLGFALAAPASAAGQEGTVLRYRFEPGQTFTYVTTTETETTQTMMGSEQTSRQTLVQGVRMEVLSVDGDGAARLSYTTESVRVTMEGPMGTLTWDSAVPDAPVPPPLQAFAGMHGGTYFLIMEPTGGVRGVEGTEDLVERMVQRMTLPPGMSPEALKADLRAQFGDESMTAAMSQNLGAFPAEGLAVGSSWTRTGRTPGFPILLETTATVVGREGGVVTLATTSTMTSDSASVLEVSQMVQRFDLAGGGTGTMEIEEATGMLVRMRTEMTMEGEMTMSMGSQELTIPMSSRSVTTQERQAGD